MRQIAVTTDVYSMIWSNRLPGEESENDILLRLLSKETPKNPGVQVTRQNVEELAMSTVPASLRHAYWWEVIEFVLERIGRPAGLSEIYRGVAAACNALGKPMPDAIEATIRGTLEDNSSDSDRFKRVRDIFCMPEGKHTGVWALRGKKP